jgi:hypothetical protein
MATPLMDAWQTSNVQHFTDDGRLLGGFLSKVAGMAPVQQTVHG